MLPALVHVLLSGGRRGRRHLCSLTLAANLLLALLNLPVPCASASHPHSAASAEDSDDFAEFEEEEELVVQPGRREPVAAPPPPPQNAPQSPPVPAASSQRLAADEDEASVDDEVDESDEATVGDEEEEIFAQIAKPKTVPTGLRITDIPAHLRGNWDSYFMELLLAAGIFVYFVNFLTGRAKNEAIARTWLQTHRDLLESNFALVGDDGKKEIEEHGLFKESESVFLVWCSGRVSVDSLLIEVRLWKRQDLLSVLSKLMKPVKDQVVLKFSLADAAMDSFVFCLATKRSAVRLLKEYTDLAIFTPERKNIEKYGMDKDKFFLLNEIAEVSAAILDPKVVSILNQHEDAIDYIHISDQFSGPKPSEYEPQPLKMPETRKVATFAFNLTASKGGSTLDGMEEKRPLLQLAFFLIDKVRKMRLSKEGKAKAEKNRQKVEESFLKATHAQRQEAAQLKREERRRAEKEKILNEEDPDKQRKWEEREYRKEIKRKAPRMKQMKVKAM